MLPPPRRSRWCCCSFLDAVTGSSNVRKVRQTSSRNLYVGANQAHGWPLLEARAMRSIPSVVLPIWRPHAATLKRAASAIIVAWAGCGVGRRSELGLVWLERSEAGEKSNERIPLGAQ